MRSVGVLPGVATLMSERTAALPGRRPERPGRGSAPFGAPDGTGDDGHRADLLPGPWRRHLRLVVGASVLWVLGWAIAVHGGRAPLRIERPLNDLLTRSRPQLQHVAFAFASLNQPAVLATVLAVILGLCAGGRSVRAAATLLTAVPATFLVCEELKLHSDRYNSFGIGTFPSGHTGVASVLATVIVLLAWRRGPLGRRLARPLAVALMVVAAAAVGAVAASMVILGAHYVTDTIAAVPIGVSITLVAARVLDSLAPPSAPGR
jgi:membrane-associated phospholipid phosphatase